MFPSAPRKNHRQEHDAENHQFEESRRIRLGGGHGYDPLFSGALSRDQYLPARHGSAVAVCFRGPEVLLHFIPVLDPVYRVFRCALRLIYFCPQGEATNPSWTIAPLSRPPEQRRTFPGRRGSSQSPQTSPRRKPSVARDSRERLVHRGCHPRRTREWGKRVAVCIRSRSRSWPTAPATQKGGLVASSLK